MSNFDFWDRPDQENILEVIKSTNIAIDPRTVQLYLEFQRTYREIERSYDTLFKTFGLSEARFVILMYLYHEPHHCLLPSEIAAKTNSTRATVSKLTAKMIDQGLVAKSASTKDKRASYVNLTARGMNVLQSFLPYNYQAVKEIMSPLSSKEEKELFNLLQKLTIGKDKLEQWEKKIG